MGFALQCGDSRAILTSCQDTLRRPWTGRCQDFAYEKAKLLLSTGSPELGLYYTRFGEGDSPDCFVIINGYTRFVGTPSLQGDALGQMVVERFNGGDQSFLNELEGSFSLCVYSAQRHTTLIATDVSATRPLWYAVDEGALCASDDLADVRALLRRECTPNAGFIYSLLRFGNGMGEATFYNEIRAIRSGCGIIFNHRNGSVDHFRYFRPEFVPDASRSMSETVDEFLSLFGHVATHIKATVERPAVLLSGGLDSRLVSQAMGGDAINITVLDTMNSEGRIAQAISKKLGMTSRVVYRDPDWYPRVFREYVDRWSCQYSWLEAHFWPLVYEDLNCDSITAGFGVDTLVKGLYSDQVTADDAFFPAEKPLDWLLKWCDAKLHGTIQIPIGPLLQRDFLTAAKEVFLTELQGCITDNLGFVSSPFDLAEAISAPGACHRFREAVNLFSIRDFLKERNMFFHSAFKRFALTLPVSYRRSGQLVRNAVTRAGLGMIPDASTWLPIVFPRALHACALYSRSRVGRVRRALLACMGKQPVSCECGWSNYDVALSRSALFRNDFENVLKNRDAFPEHIFDVKAIRNLWKRQLVGEPTSELTARIGGLGVQFSILAGNPSPWVDCVEVKSRA